MVKIHLLISFLFSDRYVSYSGHIYRSVDFTGEMKGSSFQWIRHHVTKNNPGLQQNIVQLASARRKITEKNCGRGYHRPYFQLESSACLTICRSVGGNVILPLVNTYFVKEAITT